VGGPDAPRALERCVRASDPLLRLAAVEALTRLESPPPLPVLVGLMEEPALRRVALRAMGLVRQPAAVREILRALEDPSRSVREAGLSALGVALRGADGAWTAEVEREARPALRRGTEALVAHLQEVLASEDVEARRGAVFCLSLIGEPQAALQVARAAEDDRLAEHVLDALLRMGPLAARVLAESVEQLGAPARQVAAEAIARRADASLVPALRALLASAEPELRLSAVAALGRSGAREALAPLVGALEDESLAAPVSRALVALAACFPDEVRGALSEAGRSGRAPAALQALAQVGGAESMDALRGAARHADPALRAAAARAAGEVGGQGAGELLRVGLSDEATEVRAAAARALGRSPSPDVAPLLRRLLADAEPSVRAAAVEAAGEVGGEALAPPLRALAKDPDARLSTRALKALARMGQLDGPTVRTAGGHPDPEVLREALVLGAALPEGVELAQRHLDHPRWELRAAAARVLGASGGRADLPQVERALEREQDGLVRAALEQARAQLGRR
jgi:HEAT repeat protein